MDADSLCLLMLCSPLNLPGGAAPFNPLEWSQLARLLHREGDLALACLRGESASALRSRLGLDLRTAERVARLLARSVDSALESLAGRGVRPLTRLDVGYPARFVRCLGAEAPPVLFWAGNLSLLGQPGVAVVGQRELSPLGVRSAAWVGRACAASGARVYSGAARGSDSLAMRAALDAAGAAVGLLPYGVLHEISQPHWAAALEQGSLLLLSPHSPAHTFSSERAWERNAMIYALGSQAVVVACGPGRGGTWSGSTQALSKNWLPLFVLDYPQMPPGGRLLLQRGAHPLPYPFPLPEAELWHWMQTNAGEQLPLF